MDVLLEQMKQKPNLKILVDELNQIVEDENKRREEFYDTITESDKAEFIGRNTKPQRREENEQNQTLHLSVFAVSMSYLKVQIKTF